MKNMKTLKKLERQQCKQNSAFPLKKQRKQRSTYLEI